MATVTQTLASFNNDAFVLTVMYDSVTGIVASATVTNTSGQVVHSFASDGTRSWTVEVPTGNTALPVPHNFNFLASTFTCYHRFPS